MSPPVLTGPSGNSSGHHAVLTVQSGAQQLTAAAAAPLRQLAKSFGKLQACCCSSGCWCKCAVGMVPAFILGCAPLDYPQRFGNNALHDDVALRPPFPPHVLQMHMQRNVAPPTSSASSRRSSRCPMASTCCQRPRVRPRRMSCGLLAPQGPSKGSTGGMAPSCMPTWQRNICAAPASCSS